MLRGDPDTGGSPTDREARRRVAHERLAVDAGGDRTDGAHLERRRLPLSEPGSPASVVRGEHGDRHAELTVVDGEVCHEGIRVAVAYRDYSVIDIVQLQQHRAINLLVKEALGMRIEAVAASFDRGDAGGQADTSVTGTLGSQLLRGLLVVFDYPRGRIAFVAPD